MELLRCWRYPPWESKHIINKENIVDPDDGKSWKCSACNLPIFSTPYSTITVEGSSEVLLLHDQCANLPKELKDSDLHPGKPLILRENKLSAQISRTLCNKCGKKCGTMFYHCPDYGCNIELDVLCALTSIKILHRSHEEHRLMAIRRAGSASASFICGACGTQHQDQWDIFYMCNHCGFWIHPFCASLPNIIILHHANHHHQHPLLLNYGRPSEDRGKCAICGAIVKSLGVYSCTKCRYYVHIMCAVSDPQSFKPVLIGEARLPDLVRFPIPSEHTSAIRYITDHISNCGTSTSSSSDHHDELHEHPLIFHDHDDKDDDDDDDDPRRVCNGCVQFISPPFYSCTECPDFFLHDCCAHLPPTLTQHPAHRNDHPLSLLPKTPIDKSDCCTRLTNGFIYSCEPCNFNMNVLCALMPASIMHDAHANTHILYSSFFKLYRWHNFDCCGGKSEESLVYECRTCPNFRIHARCALLPNNVRHRFDQHPLKLITTTISKWSESSSTDHDTVSSQELKLLCEVCESDIDNKFWYYSCDKCDQSFHIDCIPYLDHLSLIKFGVTTTSIRVQCHDCPLTIIRESTVCGYRCGYCGETLANRPPGVAFGCSKCYFGIHIFCAIECSQKRSGDVD